MRVHADAEVALRERVDPWVSRTCSSRPISTPYPETNGRRSSGSRRKAHSPASGCAKPDSRGSIRRMSGRATSSVTRPPPIARAPSPLHGRSSEPLTNASSGSRRSGPIRPATMVGSKSTTSASRNTPTSPLMCANPARSASPLPPSRPCASTRCTTAPASSAREPVPSPDRESTTSTSSTSPTCSMSSRRSAVTIVPIVADSSRAGSTTLTRSVRASARAAASSSAAREVRRRNQSAASDLVSDKTAHRS